MSKSITPWLSTVLSIILVLVFSPSAVYASTTTVWEPVNVQGSGVDTLSDGTSVTVSFGKAGSYDPAFANAAGGNPFFYKTDGGCVTGDIRGCVTSDTDGVVRFTFNSPRTNFKIHYGYIESSDPEFLTSDLGPIDIATYRVASGSTGNIISGQSQPESSYSTIGLIDPNTGTASATVELLLPSPVSWIEFQNDFATESTYGILSYGQNLVGVSVPVQFATVIFDANGGTGTMSSQSAATTTNLTLNTFSRVGYNFLGWNSANDGSGTTYLNNSSYSFSTDITLFAQWESISTLGGSTQPASSPSPEVSVLASTGISELSKTFGLVLLLITLGVAFIASAFKRSH